MTDKRTVSGSVSVKNDETVASVAYQMALSLWRFEHDNKNPKASEYNFIYLVGACARALGTGATHHTVEDWLEKTGLHED